VVFGQQKVITVNDMNKSGASKLKLVRTRQEAIELAKNDIKNGIPFILMQSETEPILDTLDSVFENKFKVYYYQQSFIAQDYELMKA